MKDEFQDFQENVEAGSPPAGVSETILGLVTRELNPSSWRVFSKLSGIHLFTGFLTLSVCPQFGFRLLGDGMGLMHYFMDFGDYGCKIACGAFFSGVSLLVASVALRPEEVRVLRRNRALQLGALTLLSLCFFIMFRADMVLGLTAAWFFGSVLGGLLTLELGFAMRFRAIAR